MPNKPNKWIGFFSSFNKLHNKLQSNLSLLVGAYGILIIAFITLSTHWLFQAHLNPIYEISLPPAWRPRGDINHLLGTNRYGQDIFDYLLISYRSTISMTIKATCYVIIVAATLNYTLFFIRILRSPLMLLLRLFNTIPPLLSVIIISLLLENSTTNMLIAVGIAHLPRFTYNIHQEILKEHSKTYIAAYQLDGLPPLKIFIHCIIPNIIPAYLTEIVTLFGHNMLAITSLTFLGFSGDPSHPNLGMMMFQMRDLLATNYWAFLSPGLAVTMTITLIYLLNLGLFNTQARS